MLSLDYDYLELQNFCFSCSDCEQLESSTGQLEYDDDSLVAIRRLRKISQHASGFPLQCFLARLLHRLLSNFLGRRNNHPSRQTRESTQNCLPCSLNIRVRCTRVSAMFTEYQGSMHRGFLPCSALNDQGSYAPGFLPCSLNIRVRCTGVSAMFTEYQGSMHQGFCPNVH